MKNYSDNQILDSVLAGNYRDFSIIINRYKDKAYGMLCRMLKNEQDAEEVLQDAFLKIYNSLSTFKKDSKFSTWIYSIIYNTGISFLRSKYKQKEKITDSLENFNSNVISELQYESEEENEILKFVDKLPPQNAVIIILYYIDELSVNEIGRILNLTESNVKTILYRSRKKLKDIFINERNILGE